MKFEGSTCPECGQASDAILEVNSIGTGGQTVIEGDACFESLGGDAPNWRIYIHC